MYVYIYVCVYVCWELNSLMTHLTDSFMPFLMLDDKLGADIAVGFFLIGGPIALIAGYYADMVNRCVLFGITVMLGSFASGTYVNL